MSKNQIKVALVGCGVVGSSLLTQLDAKRERIIDEFGIDIRIPIVLVRSQSERAVPQKSILYSTSDTAVDFSSVTTTDINTILGENDIDIVVEVAGGINDAHTIISDALTNNKSVVTANKALLALKGSELYSRASENGVDLLFEAAVGGGIPFIRPIRESLAVEKIHSVKAILNGTTNFMLSQMTQNGSGYTDVLKTAQELGYAEADPTADVEGHDAAAKIAIISLLATGASATQDDVQTKGIATVTSADISAARELGYVIKLIATAEKKDDNEVFLRVEPTFVPVTHPFSTVHDGFNAVFLEGEKLGEVMFYGRGAGGDPTASAVLGDLIDASINVAHDRKGAVVGYAFETKIADPREWESCFYIAAEVADEPGVLALIAEVLGKHKISVETVHQTAQDEVASIMFLTHNVADGHVIDAVSDLESLECVNAVTSVYPILS